MKVTTETKPKPDSSVDYYQCFYMCTGCDHADSAHYVLPYCLTLEDTKDVVIKQIQDTLKQELDSVMASIKVKPVQDTPKALFEKDKLTYTTTETAYADAEVDRLRKWDGKSTGVIVLVLHLNPLTKHLKGTSCLHDKALAMIVNMTMMKKDQEWEELTDDQIRMKIITMWKDSQ
jgi:hypothetical protein